MVMVVITVSLLLSCDSRKPAPISQELLDTIKAIPARVVAEPLLFENAFIKGTTQLLNDSNIYLYGINIGNIKISSGTLTACDPLHIDEYGIPFTQQFPNGEFPVQLAIAKLGREERIAFARINFSEERVAKWEFALQKGQEAIPVGGKEMHGYGVDGGVGIFADAKGIKSLVIENATSLSDTFYREMNKHNHYDWRYNIHPFGSYNVAIFSTGAGDGYYGTYIGFDSSGKPCRLLSDFNIFKWKKN